MAEVNVNQQRLMSLDAMRGFVMFLLLGGGEIGHAGFLSALFAAIHVKDLIGPLFIFVVGVAMPYSFGKRISLGDTGDWARPNTGQPRPTP